MPIIVWVAVICADCFILLGCLCAFVFVVSFVSFFGPSVLQFFPLLKLLVNRHRTRRINKEFKCLEAQLNIMELSADCSEIGISCLNAKEIWMDYQYQFCVSMEFSADCIEIWGYLIVIRIIKFASVCKTHSRNDQEDKLCARLTVYCTTSQESDLQQFSQKASLPRESDFHI